MKHHITGNKKQAAERHNKGQLELLRSGKKKGYWPGMAIYMDADPSTLNREQRRWLEKVGREKRVKGK